MILYAEKVSRRKASSCDVLFDFVHEDEYAEFVSQYDLIARERGPRNTLIYLRNIRGGGNSRRTLLRNR